MVSAEGTQPDPQKISAVKDFPVPRNMKQLRSFLGLYNYYRKFVRNFAKIAEPLNKLTGRIIVFLWDDKCQQAFDQLKTSLTQAPILAYPVRNFAKIAEPLNKYVKRTRILHQCTKVTFLCETARLGTDMN